MCSNRKFGDSACLPACLPATPTAATVNELYAMLAAGMVWYRMYRMTFTFIKLKSNCVNRTFGPEVRQPTQRILVLMDII